ncbi:hypothetical protein R5W60_05600 [Brucella pseudintermedia]|uniref:hypothetical protein n=1 Tax=Brucella pseudintermedia TaxID=370111 RepID=UPI00366A6475|nr:hypothetical protein R5W60_05600 [Brucella pseudintermedia]
MKFTVIQAAAFGLILTGCNTTPLTAVSYKEQQQLTRKFLDNCHKAGAKPGTQAEKDCFAQEVRAEQYKRGKNAHMLQEYIEMQKASAGRRVTCQSMGGYGMVTTNCY